MAVTTIVFGPSRRARRTFRGRERTGAGSSAGDLAAIEGDEDAADAGGAGDEAGQGDGVLLDAGLVARGAEGELEGARRGRLRDVAGASPGRRPGRRAGRPSGYPRRPVSARRRRTRCGPPGGSRPVASVAVTRRTFWPGAEVTGRFRRRIGLGSARSSIRATSTAFRVTRTWVMPCPPVTLPTTWSRSWSPAPGRPAPPG